MNAFNFLKKISKKNEGQLLIELLVALLLGGIMIVGATTSIVLVLRYNFETHQNQHASAFAFDLMSGVESLSESEWGKIANLTKGTSTHYYLIPSITTSTILEGEESVLFNNITVGLVGHWKFDEMLGFIAYDSSDNANTGTLASSTNHQEPQNCVASWCMGFNGTTQYMEVATSSNQSLDLNDDNAFTIAAFVYADILNQTQRFLVGKWNSGAQSYALRINTSDKIELAWNNGLVQTLAANNTTLVPYTYYYVVATFKPGEQRIYIDGELVASSAVSGNLSADTGVLRIGKQSNNTNAFVGRLDDVRIYSRVLPENEAEALYKSDVYLRYFYVENVNREGCGVAVITAASTNGCGSSPQVAQDPSTQKVSGVISWGGGKSLTLTEIITRNVPGSFSQTDWSGGSGNNGPVTSTPIVFSTSSNITASSLSISLATTSASGSLTSSIYDSNVSSGVSLNSIAWRGAKPSGTTVRFQLAYATSTSGPWNYVGSDGTAGTYFTPTTYDTSLTLTGINNYRYVRYKVYLAPSGGAGPTVDDIVINWSR